MSKRPISMQGVTLIEMLFTLLIISIGLLGLAGLQSRGQQFNHEAYIRTQATTLAYDMMDRMRANCPTTVVAGGPAEMCQINGNGLYDNRTVPAGPAPVNCLNNPCTPVQLANHDVWEWGNKIAEVWPDEGVGTIIWQDDDPANLQYRLTISWYSREFEQTVQISWVMR